MDSKLPDSYKKQSAVSYIGQSEPVNLDKAYDAGNVRQV